MRLRILLLCLAVAVLAGCAPRHASLKPGDNALLSGNSWEVNRAVMLAGERSHSLEVAIKAGEEELNARPDNDEARIILARLQSRAGRPEQALNTLEGVSAGGAAKPECLVEQARAHIASNQPAEALKLLDAAAGAQGDTLHAVKKLRGVAEDLTGNHAAAQELYRGLLTEREDSSVRFNYGRSFIASHSYSQAASALIPLVDNPDYPQARILAAGALMRSGDRAGARNLLEGYLTSTEIDALLSQRGKK